MQRCIINQLKFMVMGYYIEQKRVGKVTTYLYENQEFMNRDSFERGIEYLISLYLLPKCNGIIAGRAT